MKRQTLLARVVMRLKREGYDLTVLFIGGERDAQMTAALRSYNDAAIQLLGELHNPLEYLKLGDAYALCSSSESCVSETVYILCRSFLCHISFVEFQAFQQDNNYKQNIGIFGS